MSVLSTTIHQQNDRETPEDVAMLIRLFDQCFFHSHNTRLVRVEGDPLYLPANASCNFHMIGFAHGFFASALHEIAHWLIAGDKRRRQEDYGYWYQPGQRNASQQAAFSAVEAKPQAVEWLLSKACGKIFYVSLDNLDADNDTSEAFKQAVYQELSILLSRPLPDRMRRFQQLLSKAFQQPILLNIEDFCITELN